MRKYYCILFLIVASFQSVVAQSGCTDSQALNYDPQAQTNDGSCEYEPLVLNPELIVDDLPSQVDETSGLIWFNNGLWTHNDSGGEAAIYRLDPSSGELLQTINLLNAHNFDIEDITQDDDYIYVGDFGNNYGNRDNLMIYKINKSHIPSISDTTVPIEIIRYQYNDQQNLVRKNRNNNFDCEAMLSMNDHLYLFTKNWVDQETKCYKISKNPGNYSLDIHQTFNVKGLITGADYSLEHQCISLIGYENFVPIIWILWDFSGDTVFSGNKKRIDMAFLQGAQTEGICFSDNDQLLFSCEASFYPPSLYRLYMSQIIDPSAVPKVSFEPYQIELQPIPAQNQVVVKIMGLNRPSFDIELYNLGWQKVKQYSYSEKAFQQEVNITFPINDIPSGLYFVRIKQGTKIGFKKLVINK